MASSAHEPEPLSVTTRMAGSTRIVAVSGEIDLATAGEVADTLARRTAGEEAVVLDLSTTSFLDSSGIRVLVEAHREGERTKVPFTVVPGNENIRDLLVTTGVADHLHLAETAPD